MILAFGLGNTFRRASPICFIGGPQPCGRRTAIERPATSTIIYTTDTTTVYGTMDKNVDRVDSTTVTVPTKDGISMTIASIMLVGVMAGAGVLHLPVAVADMGWYGLGLLPVMCLLVGYSGSRLGVCWMLLEERWPEYKNEACRRPYPHIAQRAMGSVGRYITEACLNITLFGASTVYLLLVAQFAEAVFGKFFPQTHMTSCQWSLVFGVVLMPATWFGGPKDFWGTSLIAALTTLLMCVVVIVEVIKGHEDDPAPVYSPPTVKSFFLGFGAMLFTLGGAGVFPSIQNDMKDKSRFPFCVAIAYFVLLLMYTPIAGVCYGILGNNIPDNILLAVESSAVTVTQVLMLLHFLFVFNLVVNPLMQALEDTFNIPNKFGWRRCVIRTAFISLVMLVGLSVPEFGKILDLIGGSTVTVLTFLLPPLCYILLSNAKNTDGVPYRSIKKLELVVLCGIMALGVAGGAVSTWSALSEVFSPGSLNATCFQYHEFFD